MALVRSIIRGISRGGKEPNLARKPKRVLGQYNRKTGKFILDKRLIPLNPVPDLTGCKLRPYVAHNTPKLPEDEETPYIPANQTEAPQEKSA